jgi:aspartyl-tRNA(Asn)/glutamyl-tRNA(Gln) amidotransferase subunit A
MSVPSPVADAAAALAAGATTAAALVEACLERIADPAGEGARAFTHVAAAEARARAAAIDAARRAGHGVGALAGIPISVKDLFDIEGQPTQAAAGARHDAPAATTTAPAIARLIAAGMIVLGRTNMTEFAFSGLGLNPHHGTPRNPWDRATGRIPGGSSSGAAVSVADGMALAAIGTDTGGSCRVPAALCGVVGYKPTQVRVPRDGALPLSTTLDSVGPLAASVTDCALIDAVLAGEPPVPPPPIGVAGLVLPVLSGRWLAELEPPVAAAFDRALARLRDAGAAVTSRAVAAFDAVAGVNINGGFAPAEAFAWHRALLAERGALYDPMVRARIERGAATTAADLARMAADRTRLIAEADHAAEGVDAWLMPTCPVVAPPIAWFDDAERWGAVNALVLRNPAVVNFLDACAISLPIHRPGEAPVGLMLIGRHGRDARLFAVAAAVEALLHP